MAETDRLAEPSLAHCINYDYQNSVMQPFSWMERDDRGERVRTVIRYYPSDTQGDRFRCRSEVRVFGADEPVSSLQYGKQFTGGAPDPMYFGVGQRSRDQIPIRPEDFMKEIERYSGNTDCLVGNITLDGKVIRSVNRVCRYSYRPSGENSSTSSFNHTNYRSLNYHTIEGILRHVSPTQEELKAAEDNGVTPNLPINTTRYIEFVTKKGNIARMDYPNFFRAPIDEQTTVQHLRDWLEAESERQWKAIIEKERATEQTTEAAEVATKFLGAKELPEKFSWNDYISQEMLTQIIRSRNWLFPDVTEKYKRGVEQFLSYLGNHSSMNASLMLPELMNK